MTLKSLFHFWKKNVFTFWTVDKLICQMYSSVSADTETQMNISSDLCGS